MKFKRRAKFECSLEQINLAPLIDVIFQLLIFFMLTSSFTSPSGINIKLPKAITSDTIKEETFIITISAENVIYLDGAVVTLPEIRQKLSKASSRSKEILIKADRRASLGRIVDVWDLCRQLNIERLNIATDRQN